MKLIKKTPLGNSGLEVPPMIFGTSYLGNLYRELTYEEKLELMKGWFQCVEKPVVIDTAGKYGAGLALEVIGKGLNQLEIQPEEIIISNKLGWYRVPLQGEEPGFEPGVWANLKHDCEQRFGKEGIVQCFEQGNRLLGRYQAELVSIHDPDEYLNAADSPEERDRRKEEILESYQALFEMKRKGQVKAVGIGSKDWRVIRELYSEVPFDWVMLANSYTLMTHSGEIRNFMGQLENDGVGVINSALFHGGFLTGGNKFDYKEVDHHSEEGKRLLTWRNQFNLTCREYKVDPGEACIQFGLSHPAISAVALNTSKPDKMILNVRILQKKTPDAFWAALRKKGLMDAGEKKHHV